MMVKYRYVIGGNCGRAPIPHQFRVSLQRRAWLFWWREVEQVGYGLNLESANYLLSRHCEGSAHVGNPPVVLVAA